ncbi:hypothetical protein Pcinc_043557 [Petrolisthes cinctipes]|uniref:Uncharacterized protein n=1 Tax=Petrolisthes cinctipes TaxID=88211 RepID=A0AAE1EEZ6_PETCI|nr:hypothetical protein Pcinc_043557 [Petrolisthes cinctipes]
MRRTNQRDDSRRWTNQRDDSRRWTNQGDDSRRWTNQGDDSRRWHLSNITDDGGIDKTTKDRATRHLTLTDADLEDGSEQVDLPSNEGQDGFQACPALVQPSLNE